MVTTDAIEIAWCAGFYEGEGSLRVPPSAPRSVQMTVHNSDVDALERFRRAMGGRVRGPFQPSVLGRKPMYDWRATKWSEVEPVLLAIMPHLMARRRAKAEECLALKPSDLRPRRDWARVPIGECPPEPIASQVGYRRHAKAGTEPCAICTESVRLYGRLRKQEQCEKEGRKYVPRPWRMETLERKGRKIA